jgi:hypothetical protein
MILVSKIRLAVVTVDYLSPDEAQKAARVFLFLFLGLVIGGWRTWKQVEQS